MNKWKHFKAVSEGAFDAWLVGRCWRSQVKGEKDRKWFQDLQMNICFSPFIQWLDILFPCTNYLIQIMSYCNFKGVFVVGVSREESIVWTWYVAQSENLKSKPTLSLDWDSTEGSWNAEETICLHNLIRRRNLSWFSVQFWNNLAHICPRLMGTLADQLPGRAGRKVMAQRWEK